MKSRYLLGFFVLLLSFLVSMETLVLANNNISAEEAKRLKVFLKRRLGTNLPQDAKIEVKGYEKSPIAGFKKGTFVVESSRGSGEASFLISDDGRYIIFGEPVNTQEFENTGVAGIKKGEISLGRQSVPVLISSDGKFLILGELIDSTVNPLEETMSKISLNDVPVKGDKNAKVTIVEYSDFQCPFCKRATDMLPQIMEQYKGKVKLVYKQFPLPSHPWAKDAAVASVCAYKQGNEKFWKFHDLVFEKQKEITVENSKDKFRAFAQQIGLDTKKFEQCVNSKEASERVEGEIREGMSVGVNSTPTFIVNGMTVRGATPEGLKAAIDASLSGNI
ncbi:MAG: hypothetical protein KatS3mg078_0294 [Deltaproteobacteria bacterium]|nr:MAG: hypothetical protein KatS3mg078_0294 [Deltaproteobacteria bacterium]